MSETSTGRGPESGRAPRTGTGRIRGLRGLGLLGALGAIAAGGVAGPLARYALGAAFPPPPDGFPWATFGVNVGGCLLIGVLMAVVTGSARVHPLVRPFLGVGVLGGFTTFSSSVVDALRVHAAGAGGLALVSLVGTLAGGLVAVCAGLWVTRLIMGTRPGAFPYASRPHAGSAEADR
jgi:fluoride exporter